MKIKAIIWDMGGVLLRTEDDAPRQRLAERLGKSRSELEELVFWGESGSRAQLGEITIDQHWENLRGELNLTSDGLDQFKEEFWRGDLVDEELVGYIRSLRKRYKTGLLSNAFSNLRQVIDEIWMFTDAFDEMIISAEVGLVKPDDRIYRIALERLEVGPEEAIFIDDFNNNVHAASLLNMPTIHFKNSEQARQDLEQILEGKRV